MIVTIAALLLLAPQNYARSPAPTGNERVIEAQKQEDRDHGKGGASPVFVTTPTSADVDAAYPSAARLAQEGGEATVRCKIGKDGRFADCKVLSETPKKYGFGEAALSLSKIFLLETKATDGSSMVGRSLTIPMKFTPKT